jgi:hypothetical protein
MPDELWIWLLAGALGLIGIGFFIWGDDHA